MKKESYRDIPEFIDDLRGELQKYEKRAEHRKGAGVFYKVLYKSDLSEEKLKISKDLDAVLEKSGFRTPKAVQEVVEAVVKARFDSLDEYINSEKQPGKLDKILDKAIDNLIKMGHGDLVEKAVARHQAESIHKILMHHQSMEVLVKSQDDPNYAGVHTFITALNKIDKKLKTNPDLESLHALRREITSLLDFESIDPKVKDIQKWLENSNTKLGQLVSTIEREMVDAPQPGF